MFDALGYQEIFGGVAFLIRAVAGLIYIVSILQGKTKPHLYTWFVFTILTLIAFFAQLSDNAGPGAWMMGVTALSCCINALLSFSHGEKNITRSDKIALAASLTAILPWLITKDPLGSVILACLIDSVAMFPTLRKSWNKPYQENLTFHTMTTFNVFLSIVALSNISLITTLYPAAIIVVNLSLIFLCVWRRRIIPAQ